jgi:hypothetical protein
MKFQKKPVVVEAITFDELVAHGLASGEGDVIGGMPWSFTYAGHRISHENDDCYLIPTPEGTMKMGRGDMLITGVKGEIYPSKLDIFQATYEPVQSADFGTEGIVAAAPGRPMSFGERAVGLDHNPSGNPAVYQCKSRYAALIDQLEARRQSTTDREVARLCSVAITEAQAAQMWAVKALTWNS